MSYHVNPKTGNPGLCKAKKQCPFGEAEDHYATKEEAAKSYETAQEEYTAFVARSIIPQGKGAYTLAVFEKDEEAIKSPFSQTSTNRHVLKYTQDAPAGARLVLENGNVWEKSSVSMYGSDSWKFVSGEYDPYYRLEPKRTYSGAYVRNIIRDHGGRLEAGGRKQELHSNDRPRVSGAYQSFAKEVNKKVHEVTGANAKISQEDETIFFVPEQNLTKKEINDVLKSNSNLQYLPAGTNTSSNKWGRLDDKDRFFVWTNELD